MSHRNSKDLGRSIPNWAPPPWPTAEPLRGTYVELEPLRADKHAALLFPAYAGADHVWDYLPYGPFSSAAAYYKWVQDTEAARDPMFFAICDRESGRWAGVASYLRISPDMGTIEVGHINYSPVLQNTRAGTEAMYLMMRNAFEAGYRRYEWKCNALNLGSRRAAQRLGFSYEGVFRQAAVVKGRNRDTAWFAAIDTEWPALREAFDAWLSPGNFDDQGQQRERLGDLTRLVRVASDPALNA